MTKSNPSLVLPTGRPLHVSGLCGDWRTTDRTGAGGLHELTVTEHEGSLWVRGLGMAKPAAYAWHRVRAGSYAQDPTSSQAWSFLADYDFGFMRTTISGYHKLGILIATTYNIFRDDRTRADYWTREFFHRRLLADPTPSPTPPPGITRARDRRVAPERRPLDPTGQLPSRLTSLVDTASLIGRWVNFDPTSPGITGVTIRAGTDQLTVEIDALGPDGIRRWPELQGVAMADHTGGGPAVGFLATGALFAERSEGPHVGTLCAYLNRGLLTIDAHLTDVHRPANVMIRTHLYLAEEIHP
jgi:hypothetical protein